MKQTHTAHAMAEEFRRIADSLDKEPETLLTFPMLTWYCDEKEHFLSLARLLPRPLKKPFEKDRYVLEIKDSSSVWTRALIDRSKVCKLVKPAQDAVYECVPLLSDEEEAALEQPSVFQAINSAEAPVPTEATRA